MNFKTSVYYPMQVSRCYGIFGPLTGATTGITQSRRLGAAAPDTLSRAACSQQQQEQHQQQQQHSYQKQQ
jgi:hypothetical protein